jgi:Bifunctional DNA primase/polymerase, N-terminal
MHDDNLAVALACAEAEIYVFPLIHTPRTYLIRWKDGSSVDRDRLRWWWKKWPQAVVGINMERSRLLALDGDQHADDDGVIHHDGVEALRDLLRGQSLARNPIAWSPRGGVHIYFQADGTRNSVSLIAPGVDVRGDGGMIIAPGSVLPDGRSYKPDSKHPDLWDAPRPLPRLPEHIADLLKPKPVPIELPVIRQKSGKRHENYAAVTLDGISRELAGMAPETGRNEYLKSQSFRMGTMINRGWIDHGTVYGSLSAAAIASDTPGWKATLTSGLNKGSLIPHSDLPERRTER